MANVENLESDLSYVRGALRRRESSGHMPLAISAYWAIAMALGFALIDFAPRYTAIFWLIAAPLGFVYSILMGRRSAAADGERNMDESSRIVQHFGALLLVIFLTPLLLLGNGAGNAESIGRVSLLLVAFAYMLAGVHFERRMLFAGTVMLAGFVALAFLHTYVWTAIGILGGIALLASSGAGIGSASAQA